MKDTCFWSIGDGDYATILQGLVNSFHHAGMKEDFHVFSDREIKGAINHPSGKFDKLGCFFKFNFLKQVKEWDYRNFIYIDADTLFLKSPSFPLINLLEEDPLHFFVESDCTIPHTFRKEWWGCPLTEYVRLMRDCGVSSPQVYNVNGGFFIVQKHVIDLVCELAMDFARYASHQGYPLPDEPAWAYAFHMLSKSPEKHLLSQHWNTWCSDWEGIFKTHLPNREPWFFHEFMTNSQHKINPAIVHLIRSKQLLINLNC